MLKVKLNISILFFLCLLAAFVSCAGAPSSQSGTRQSGSSQPDWVNDPYRRYNRLTTLAAVGSGTSRQAAESNAMGNLVAGFGQSIIVDDRISTSYLEVVRSGVGEWSETTSIESSIITSAGLETLVGAEIGDVWLDTRLDVFYAAAIMDKARAARIYTEMILSNIELINTLTNMTAAERNSLEGYARYMSAAAAADVNLSYVSVLNGLDAPAPRGVRPGNEYRIEAANTIAPNISVRVVMLSGNEFTDGRRILDAFSRAVGDYGLRTSADAARYTLEINLSLTEEPSGTQNVFVRYTVSARFIDTGTRQEIIPVYSINDREGHLDLQRAQNRAITAAERIINEGDHTRNPQIMSYKDYLESHVSQMFVRTSVR